MHQHTDFLFKTGKVAGTITAVLLFSLLLSLMVHTFTITVYSYLKILVIVTILFGAFYWGRRKRWL